MNNYPTFTQNILRYAFLLTLFYFLMAGLLSTPDSVDNVEHQDGHSSSWLCYDHAMNKIVNLEYSPEWSVLPTTYHDQAGDVYRVEVIIINPNHELNRDNSQNECVLDNLAILPPPTESLVEAPKLPE